MTTLREGIMSAVLNKLVTMSSLASTKVFRSRETAITRAESPCIVLRKVSEADPETFNVSQRELVFAVDIFSRGENAEVDTDAIENEVHSKLMAERTLGGKCTLLKALDTEWASDDADQDAHKATMKFSALYRCQSDDLSSKGEGQ
jgi:hypothetical protein